VALNSWKGVLRHLDIKQMYFVNALLMSSQKGDRFGLTGMSSLLSDVNVPTDSANANCLSV
jgi:hypothetical protein